jgi:hypothetical protein
MKLSGRLMGLSEDYITGKVLMTLEINEKGLAKEIFSKLKETAKLVFTFKKYSPKRSLNANNYAWHLMNEIGNVLRQDKEKVYHELLRRYGQSEMISVRSEISLEGYFKYFDEIGETVLNDKPFKHYRIYKGSSEFDTREMSVFIDGVVSEAKELGIPTETPDELARLKSLWRENEEENKSA